MLITLSCAFSLLHDAINRRQVHLYIYVRKPTRPIVVKLFPHTLSFLVYSDCIRHCKFACLAIFMLSQKEQKVKQKQTTIKLSCKVIAVADS